MVVKRSQEYISKFLTEATTCTVMVFIEIENKGRGPYEKFKQGEETGYTDSRVRSGPDIHSLEQMAQMLAEAIEQV